ncbi:MULTISPECIES: transposase family protein [Actinomadura]|uniref:transposase family protein n=1 Tax=Actinomadura sp. NPDC000929 TaxID=3154517 RepID=UPI003394D771
MSFYRAALDLSRSAPRFVADLIRRHRHRVAVAAVAARSPGALVLVYLRGNEAFAGLAVAFGVDAATAHRYVTEMIELLADLAPDLRIAQRKAYVILDGTLVATDQLSGAYDRLHCSGKHRRHDVNVQFLTDPHGELVWASLAVPGATHELAAAREHGIIDAVTDRAIACRADKGYVEAGGAVGTPCKRKKHRKLGRAYCAARRQSLIFVKSQVDGPFDRQ